jgi:hypothetical protein
VQRQQPRIGQQNRNEQTILAFFALSQKTHFGQKAEI